MVFEIDLKKNKNIVCTGEPLSVRLYIYQPFDTKTQVDVLGKGFVIEMNFKHLQISPLTLNHFKFTGCLEALYNQGLAYKALGDTVSAEASFLKADCILRSCPEILYQLAILAHEQGKLEEVRNVRARNNR